MKIFQLHEVCSGFCLLFERDKTIVFQHVTHIIHLHFIFQDKRFLRRRFAARLCILSFLYIFRVQHVSIYLNISYYAYSVRIDKMRCRHKLHGTFDGYFFHLIEQKIANMRHRKRPDGFQLQVFHFIFFNLNV